MAEHTTTEQVEMMTDPDRWPQWPMLPVKKYVEGETWPHCAVHLDLAGPFVIYEWKGFMRPDAEKVAATYDSAQAAVDDGWVVD